MRTTVLVNRDAGVAYWAPGKAAPKVPDGVPTKPMIVDVTSTDNVLPSVIFLLTDKAKNSTLVCTGREMEVWARGRRGLTITAITIAHEPLH